MLFSVFDYIYIKKNTSYYMTKTDLKNLIKECVAEVTKENQYPKPTATMTSDQVIQKRNDAWLKWAEIKKELEAIKNTPEFITKVNALQHVFFDKEPSKYDQQPENPPQVQAENKTVSKKISKKKNSK